jgi:hypothetical protein
VTSIEWIQEHLVGRVVWAHHRTDADCLGILKAVDSTCVVIQDGYDGLHYCLPWGCVSQFREAVPKDRRVREAFLFEIGKDYNQPASAEPSRRSIEA